MDGTFRSGRRGDLRASFALEPGYAPTSCNVLPSSAQYLKPGRSSKRSTT